jgi:ribosomal protein S18 acetylase RimI-like enzyme
MPVAIRILTKDDAAAYWHLRLDALESEPQSFGDSAEEHRATSVESAAERLAAHPDENFVFGAFDAGQIVGMAGFYRNRHANARHNGHLWGVYVHPRYRGQGIGRVLVAAVMERIRACPGVEQVMLTVACGQAAARALYCSFGFASYGIVPRGRKIGGQYFDDEHMVLRL